MTKTIQEQIEEQKKLVELNEQKKKLHNLKAENFKETTTGRITMGIANWLGNASKNFYQNSKEKNKPQKKGFFND